MFGYTLIKKSELNELKKYELKFHKLISIHRWFSGWKDLDIIWNYILFDNQPTINDVRKLYAEARKTNEYGE